MILDYTDNVTMPENAAPTMLAGRYRIVRQLGQGGMGSVWLAEDTKLDGRKVAIKMLPSILVCNKRAYAQVKAEALVSLKLVHQNIVPVRAFEEENGNPFLVMDYIDGQTLDDYLAEKGKLSEDETVKLLKPIADALDYAHSHGVVHRDVKPGNVMIDKSGHPYILDFGIAREIQETMTRVTGKLSSGTLMYMSPEQLNGAVPKPAQDVYSFAAMVYECLRGEPPFSRGQIEFQIINNNPEPLADEIATRSQVMAGLAKSPEERPVTCAAVLVGESCVPHDHTGASGNLKCGRIKNEIRGVEVVRDQKKDKREALKTYERSRSLQGERLRQENLRRHVETESLKRNAVDVKTLVPMSSEERGQSVCSVQNCQQTYGSVVNARQREGLKHLPPGRVKEEQPKWVSGVSAFISGVIEIMLILACVGVVVLIAIVCHSPIPIYVFAGLFFLACWLHFGYDLFEDIDISLKLAIEEFLLRLFRR